MRIFVAGPQNHREVNAVLGNFAAIYFAPQRLFPLSGNV
jgi:hypothetical protein